MELLVKFKQDFCVQEVDKAVAHVAIVLIYKNDYFDVAGQVQEIVRILETLVDLCRQVLDRVLVRNVFYHESCARVMTDVVRIDLEDSIVEITQLLRHNVLRCGEGCVGDVLLVDGQDERWI